MASLDGASPHDDLSVDALAYPEFTTPSYQSIYPLLYAPLALPRDGPDGYFSSLLPFGDPYDFQSNHLENPRSAIDTPLCPLSGLGIRNIDFSKDKDTDPQDLRISRTESWFGPQSHECRSVHRNSRTDSVYEAPEESMGDLPNDSLASPWIYSGILVPAEQDLERLNLDETGDPFSSNSSQEVSSAFEKISASTGMSVADFAAQVSATAEETLRRMSCDKFMGDPAPFELNHYRPYNDFDHNYNPWVDRLTSLSSPSLLQLENSPRHSSWNPDCVGVNPADICSVSAPSISAPRRIFITRPDEPVPTYEGSKECPPDDQPVTPGTPEAHVQPGVPGSPSEKEPRCKSRSSSKDLPQKSDDEPSIFQSSSSSEYSPTVQPLSLKRNVSSRINTRRTTRKTEDFDTAYTDYHEADQYNHLPINLGTPVFDAHRGIDIEELKAKAERYRLRNQGRDYDKRWLISFAGKLSEKGELVEEFRCYVSGCKQNNKRRDHILIHVGAHLDQRPFKCTHWYVSNSSDLYIYILISSSSARFLRKNECKRHELSHTGIRPFACHLCPSPTTTFVRQDLLKRHMKRTHHIDFKADKENEDNSRPRKRARH